MRWALYILLCAICASASANFITAYEQHFGSKTPYRVVQNDNTTPIEFEGCQPKKIWYIIRHGARTPTDDVGHELQENLPRIMQTIIRANEHRCDRYVDELKKWKMPFGNETVLTEEGGRELFNLALRTQARFPTLFPKTYSKEHYHFQYTDTLRTLSSAQNFTFGLFGSEYGKVEYPTPLLNDPVLRFHKKCKRWREQVDGVYEEVNLFRKSNVVAKVIAAVNKRLNLKNNNTLTFDDIQSMYKGCVHEGASFNNSIWCSLLSFKAIKVFEFVDSLESYHKNGYLYNTTYKQACPLFKSMLDFFESEEENPPTTVYFSHDGTILKFYAHLGLFKDEHDLKHTDFERYYKWDVSKIGPFATNIAFVLYSCSSTEKMAVFFNERLMDLPNCGTLCNLETIKLNYNDSINCEYNQICNITKSIK